MRNLRLYRTDASFKANEIAAGGDGNKVESIVPGVVKTMDLRKTYFNPHDEAFRVHMINVSYVNEHGVEVSPSQIIKVKYIPGVEQEIVITPKEVECYKPIEGQVTVSVPNDTSVVFHHKPAPDPRTPLTFKIISGGTLYWKNSGSTSTTYTREIEYKKNDGEWTSIRSNTGSSAPSISVAAGDTVQFRGDNATYNAYGGPSYFNCFSASSSSVILDIIGNVMSLISSTDFVSLKRFDSANTFMYLFNKFYGLRNTEAMLLPATTLADYCYGSMFYGCTSLTTAPELPATTSANYCYQGMFNGCTSLTTAPELPATTLADYCYGSMFSGCTSLTEAPKLPATTLRDYCYYCMFGGCTNLATAPELPATTLAPYCYYGMFRNCASLTTAPELPATTLEACCYSYMFYGCSLLTTAPELPATAIKAGSYDYMFYSCSNLSFIACLATSFATNNGGTQLWSVGVASSGVFVKSPEMTGWTIGMHGIPDGWVVQDAGINVYRETETCAQSGDTIEVKLLAFADWSASTDDSWITLGQTGGTSSDSSITISVSSASTPRSGSVTFVSEINSITLVLKQDDSLNSPLTFVVSSGGILKWKVNNIRVAKTISYKVNDGEWKDITSTTFGEYIGNDPESGAGGTYEVSGRDTEYGFIFNGNYYESTNSGTSYTASNCRVNLSLSSTCKVTFHYLCSGYSSSYDTGVFGYLDRALDTGYSTTDGYATTGSYSTTEKTVSYIIENPGEHFIDVKFKTSYYARDYAFLKFRVTVEDYPIPMLNVGDVVQIVGNNASYSNGDAYYNYFNGNCEFSANGNITSLINSVDYGNVKTLTSSATFKNLFDGCTGLTSAKNLTLALTNLTGNCYRSMFNNCTSLIEAPELPATTLASNCYQYMFNGCTSLTTAPELPATTLATYCYSYMFSGCTSLTQAPELPATTLENYCYDSMFSDCASLTTAPSLPATTLTSDCYNGMFSGCISLATAPELPATTLVRNCYRSMFYGCTSLTQTQVLPATTLAYSCYNSMFYGCTSLTQAPELPATTLASYCYNGMFGGCTSLTQTQVLPATTLADYCYQYMFSNCTSLTTAPSLPATTLASNCYDRMFQGCTSLTTAPSLLPATTLAYSCYNSMFYGCTSLTQAPELPATTLASSCYFQMFYGCTSLNYIKCLATDISASNCTSNWVSGVASSGTFVKNPATNWTTGASGIPDGWITDFDDVVSLANTKLLLYQSAGTKNVSVYAGINWSASTDDSWITLSTETGTSGTSTIILTVTEASTPRTGAVRFVSENNEITLKVYQDNNMFKHLTINVISAGTVYFKASNSNYRVAIQYSKNNGSWTNITATTAGAQISVNAGDSVRFRSSGGTTSYTTRCGFSGNTAIKFNVEGNIMSLLNTADTFYSVETVSTSAFTGLFSGCTSLVSAENLRLPATTLANYCYQSMFYNCTSLTTAPALPATTLANNCYYSMFNGCTSLTTAPELPATTLENSCYGYMFYNCRALTTAPELPATTLASQCYYYMFYNCMALNYIKCLATDISSNSCTYYWVNGVASTGTFVKNPNMTGWVRGTSGIPTNWTVQDVQL